MSRQILCSMLILTKRHRLHKYIFVYAKDSLLFTVNRSLCSAKVKQTFHIKLQSIAAFVALHHVNHRQLRILRNTHVKCVLLLFVAFKASSADRGGLWCYEMAEKRLIDLQFLLYRHIPKAKATTIAETPELKRIAENTKLQSNAKYHADFEKAKGKLTQVRFND